jgi:transcriptional regulator with XRE-family HTH domain
MQYYQKHLAKRLHDLRKGAQLTQAQLAARLGVNQSYIAKLEGGKDDKQPTIDFLLSVGKLFHVGMDDLLGTQPDAAQSGDLLAGLSSEDRALALALISRLRNGAEGMDADWRRLSDSVTANGGHAMVESFESDLGVFLEPSSN